VIAVVAHNGLAAAAYLATAGMSVYLNASLSQDASTFAIMVFGLKYREI
jgi:hypothetical protein